MTATTIRHVSVLGCGLIGTSIALALRKAGVHVRLSDRDADSVAKAVRMEAGVALTSDDPPADVVVIATPPSTVVGVLRDAQARGLGTVYTDVASTKAGILADAESAGCDFTSYVPGHPMAGRELSGPGAAQADLFADRRWVLCPHPATPPGRVMLVAELAALCGARHTLVQPDVHDRAVAMVSHAPHLVSAAVAARFAGADETTLSLVGRGLQDVTRVASGAPGLWSDILRQNADSVAAVLDAVIRDLSAAAAALRSPGHGVSDVLADLLIRGNRGRALILHTDQSSAPAQADAATHDAQLAA
ncbi:prephenate dehydrogenase [Planotetraspora sp. GP83]|uniref:prephenate dehydrogenase n=1 Tax=Planotetraspora sp. GP83 TaxID=3156264 RepID=UPI0035195565